MQTFSFRFRPGQDLGDSIDAWVKEQKLEAGCVLCAVGSLTHATIRLADRQLPSEYEGPFEIVSLIGTLSLHGSHLHIAISDRNGITIGGHLLSGCTIYTTAEIVIAHFPQQVYRREFSNDSGFEELVVSPRETP